MKKMINKVSLCGKLYEHKLERKVSGANSKNPGTEYIAGSVGVATDPECLNVVQVYYTYVTATTSKNKENPTFSTLSDIIDGKIKSVTANGKDEADKVRVDSQIGLNEFYTTRNGKEELVSTKRATGGFIHKVSANDPLIGMVPNQFACDYMITNVRTVEGEPERGTKDKVILKGAIFNDYNKTLMPVEFSVVDDGPMGYFSSLEVNSSNPMFAEVRGYQINETIVRRIEESTPWGTTKVREVPSSRRDWVVDYISTTPYDFGDESILTADEVNEAIKTREVMLANLKSRNEEYRNNSKSTPTVAASKEKFDF